jgi:hypothetical protein
MIASLGWTLCQHGELKSCSWNDLRSEAAEGGQLADECVIIK